MATLHNVGQSFTNLVLELARRCRVEKQSEGWAVIVDGEVHGWAETDERARQIAIDLIESYSYWK